MTKIGSLTPIGNAPSLTTTKDSEFENEATVVSNKGNTYDNTKSKNHRKGTADDAKMKGEPDSSVDIYDREGKLVRRRWYDWDGRVIRDLDYTDHNNPTRHPEVPHEHDWEFDENGIPNRSKGK